MTGSNFIVPPRSWDDIGLIADNVRAQFGLSNRPDFPIMTLLEKVLDEQEIVMLRVGDEQEMGMAEGLTCPNGEYIELRADVYRNAWNGDGRARFTAAHELGHYLLHSTPGNEPLARATSQMNVKAFRLSEPQANQFAAELLMPRSLISSNDTAAIVAARHEVSPIAAGTRLQFLRKRGII